MGFPEPTPNEIVPEIEMAQELFDKSKLRTFDMDSMVDRKGIIKTSPLQRKIKLVAKKLVCQIRAGIEYSKKSNTSPAVKQAVVNAKKVLDSVASNDANFKALLDCATGSKAIAECADLVDEDMAQSWVTQDVDEGRPKVMETLYYDIYTLGSLGDLKSDFKKITTNVAKAKACAPPSE